LKNEKLIILKNKKVLSVSRFKGIVKRENKSKYLLVKIGDIEYNVNVVRFCRFKCV
jgi:hypothetical protein